MQLRRSKLEIMLSLYFACNQMFFLKIGNSCLTKLQLSETTWAIASVGVNLLAVYLLANVLHSILYC